jgi:PAS domain S-box-containing protein
MIDAITKLFYPVLMLHDGSLSPALLTLNAASDAIIAIAYFFIPLALLRLLQKRRDITFHWLFVLTAAFFLACGSTHVLAIMTILTPIYRFDAFMRAITAIASLLTAALLIRLIPRLAKLPSPEQLQEQNVKLQELKAAWDLAHGLIRDLQGSITFWCHGSQELYGWSKQEATGQNSHVLLATKFPKPLPEIELELNAKGSWSGELIHTTKAGAHLHVATHWVLQRNPVTGAVSVIEVNNDITDRLRADEASQRLANIVESSQDAIIGSTLHGAIISWNTSAESLFGYSASEMIGQSVLGLVPPVCRDVEAKILEDVGQGSGARHYETVRLAKSGRHIPVALTVSPICDSTGRVMGTSQIVHDITQTKAHAEAIRFSEERQRLAAEAGQVGLWYMDVDSGRCLWTQRCKELHGLKTDSPVPDFPGPMTLVHADDRARVEQAMQETLAGKSDLSIEYRTRGPDFRIKWIESRGRVQRDLNGVIKGLHGTVIDLTARRQMEDQLRRVNTELEQFAYAAAHDLQEPLRNVALAAAILQTNSDAADQRRLLSVVIDDALRMEAMVKDLLAYSRSLDGAGDLNTAPATDANRVLAKVLQNLSTAIHDTAAEISYDRLPCVFIHETHLLQLLQNLISNSLKYSHSSPVRIQVGAKVRSEDVLLFVKDNGIGIAPQFHDRAFGMFKRLHNGSAKGTGIGLAVCKRIVEHYGGHIWIESQAGEGATFFFTIPALENS